MKVCFSVGPMSSRLAESLSNSIDNVEFFSYNSIGDMIKESTMRHIFFDRLIFSEKLFKNIDSELISLKAYLDEYSDSSSVVLICQGYNSSIKDTFTKVFDSPLCTPVIASPLTVNTLAEFVKGDISSLKSKYYKVEENKVEAITRVTDEGSATKIENPKKQGFLKGLFGSKKNKSDKIKTDNDLPNDTNSLGKAIIGVPQNSSDNTTRNESAVIEKPVNSVESNSATKFDGEDKTTFTDEVLGSPEVSENELGNNAYSEEVEDLGIGDFGELHTDTGFFDDEEDLEDDSVREIINTLKEDSKSPYKHMHSFDLNIKGAVLVTGNRDQYTNCYVKNYAYELLGSGKKVLVIDLDYKYNRIISLVNIGEFMSKNKYMGIRNKEAFRYEGIDYMSNGIGFSISNVDIENTCDIIKNYHYDVIIIDSPLDCLNRLGIGLISLCKVVLLLGKNDTSLISSILDLCNISCEIGDYLYNNSELVVNDSGILKDNICIIRDKLLFSRGNWLDKLI